MSDLKLSTEITVESTQAKQNLELLKTAVNELTTSINQSSNAKLNTENIISSVKSAQQTITSLINELNKLTQQSNVPLGDVAKNIPASANAANAALNNLEQILNKLKQETNTDLHNPIQPVTSGANIANTALNTLNQGLNQSVSTINQHTDASNKAGDALLNFNKTILALNTAFNAINKIKEVVVDFNEFDEASRRAWAAADVGSISLKELQTVASTVGPTLGKTSTEAAQALKELMQAGYTTSEAIQSLPTVLKFAELAELSTADATTKLVRVLNEFGLSSKDMASTGNILVAATDASTMSVKSLSSGLSYVGPLAHAAGLTLTETATILGKLADAGDDGSRSGTRLREMLTSILAPTDKTIAAFKSMEISLFDSNNRIKSIIDIAEEFRIAMQNMNDKTKATGVAVEAFGIRAASSFLNFATVGKKALTDTAEATALQIDAMKRKHQQLTDGLKGATDKMAASWDTLKIKIVDSFVPSLEAAFNGIAVLSNKLSNTIENNSESFKIWSAAGLGITAMLATLGTSGIAPAIAGITALASAGVSGSVVFDRLSSSAQATNAVINNVTTAVQSGTQAINEHSIVVNSNLLLTQSKTLSEEKLATTLREVNSQTGLNINTAKEFDAALQKGIVILDEKTGVLRNYKTEGYNLSQTLSDISQKTNVNIKSTTELTQALSTGAIQLNNLTEGYKKGTQSQIDAYEASVKLTNQIKAAEAEQKAFNENLENSTKKLNELVNGYKQEEESINSIISVRKKLIETFNEQINKREEDYKAAQKTYEFEKRTNTEEMESAQKEFEFKKMEREYEMQKAKELYEFNKAKTESEIKTNKSTLEWEQKKIDFKKEAAEFEKRTDKEEYEFKQKKYAYEAQKEQEAYDRKKAKDEYDKEQHQQDMDRLTQKMEAEKKKNELEIQIAEEEKRLYEDRTQRAKEDLAEGIKAYNQLKEIFQTKQFNNEKEKESQKEKLISYGKEVDALQKIFFQGERNLIPINAQIEKLQLQGKSLNGVKVSQDELNTSLLKWNNQTIETQRRQEALNDTLGVTSKAKKEVTELTNKLIELTLKYNQSTDKSAEATNKFATDADELNKQITKLQNSTAGANQAFSENAQIQKAITENNEKLTDINNKLIETETKLETAKKQHTQAINDQLSAGNKTIQQYDDEEKAVITNYANVQKLTNQTNELTQTKNNLIASNINYNNQLEANNNTTTEAKNRYSDYNAVLVTNKENIGANKTSLSALTVETKTSSQVLKNLGLTIDDLNNQTGKNQLQYKNLAKLVTDYNTIQVSTIDRGGEVTTSFKGIEEKTTSTQNATFNLRNELNELNNTTTGQINTINTAATSLDTAKQSTDNAKTATDNLNTANTDLTTSLDTSKNATTSLTEATGEATTKENEKIEKTKIEITENNNLITSIKNIATERKNENSVIDELKGKIDELIAKRKEELPIFNEIDAKVKQRELNEQLTTDAIKSLIDSLIAKRKEEINTINEVNNKAKEKEANENTVVNNIKNLINGLMTKRKEEIDTMTSVIAKIKEKETSETTSINNIKSKINDLISARNNELSQMDNIISKTGEVKTAMESLNTINLDGTKQGLDNIVSSIEKAIEKFNTLNNNLTNSISTWNTFNTNAVGKLIMSISNLERGLV